MTTPDVSRLPSLLSRKAQWNLQLDSAKTDILKSAARFWFPPKPPTNREGCQKALVELFAKPAEMVLRLATLPAIDQAILQVYKRYGGAVSGMILRTELLTRGLVTLPVPDSQYMRPTMSRERPYAGLENKLLVLSIDPRQFYIYYSYMTQNRYTDMVANPAALVSVTAAEPAPWRPTCSAPAPSSGTRSSFTEFVLNLWTTAQELDRNNGWKPNKIAILPKSVLNKIRKALPQPTADLPTVPDLPEFYCELLKALGAFTTKNDEVRINLELVQNKLNAPTAELAFTLTKTWLLANSWQDGIGTLDLRQVVNLADQIHTVRELLTWGLGALARHDNGDGWFNLESFLRQLWNVQQEDTPYFMVISHKWVPEFSQTKQSNDTSMLQRSWALWLSGTGVCCTNAILGTFVHMGLVERGPVTDQGPFVFRLTALGRIVFGSPDVLARLPTNEDTRFLTVQPNFEVVAFIDDVPSQSLLPLARFARRTSSNGSKVHTFVIDRDSVYRALEAGFTVDRIREYLTAHARNTLAPNVLRTLEEWGGKRESLVLRRGVSLLVEVTSPPKYSRVIGNGFHLLDGATTVPKTVSTISYPDRARPCCVANEDGLIRLDLHADLIAVARLRQLAELTKNGELQITRSSIVAAKKRGITVEQMLTQLSHHHSGTVPAVLEVAIRNWIGSGQVVLNNHLMLQVPDQSVAAALRDSKRFKPLIVRHIPPDWFVVDGKRRKELESLLRGIGYTWASDA